MIGKEYLGGASVVNGWIMCESKANEEKYCVRINDVHRIVYSLEKDTSLIMMSNGMVIACDGNVIDLVPESN